MLAYKSRRRFSGYAIQTRIDLYYPAAILLKLSGVGLVSISIPVHSKREPADDWWPAAKTDRSTHLHDLLATDSAVIWILPITGMWRSPLSSYKIKILVSHNLVSVRCVKIFHKQALTIAFMMRSHTIQWPLPCPARYQIDNLQPDIEAQKKGP